jgi:hypothetical protein
MMLSLCQPLLLGSLLAATCLLGQEDLQRPGRIEGRVVDSSTGAPVPRTLVAVTSIGVYGTAAAVDSARVPAGELGDFRIYNLPPGRYLLRATPPAGPAPGGAAGEASLPTSYGGALDLSPGQILSGITIALRRGPVYRIQGKVTGIAPSSSTSDLTLMLTPRDARGPSEMAAVLAMAERVGGARGVGADGSFALADVEPGAYFLTAMRVLRRTDAFGRVPVDVVGGDVSGVVVPLGGALELLGTVRVEGREKTSLGPVSVLLSPRGADPILGTSQGRLDAGGSFRIDGVLAGKYLLGFEDRLLRDYFVKSVRLGDQEIVDKGLDLTQVRSGASIDVLLSRQGASVAGIVRDGGTPTPGRPVTLAPDPPRAELSLRLRSAASDEKGRFTITGVAPGTYRLYAWAEPVTDVLADPEFLKQFQAQSTPVSVGEGQSAQADATLIKPGDARKP